jgi:hypothetical protein
MTSAQAGNGVAGRVEPDGETVTENVSEDETPSKRLHKWNGHAQFMLLKRWATSERAEMEEEDINRVCMHLPAIGWPKASFG